MKIEFDQFDLEVMSKELRRLSSIRWDGVCLTNLTQMRNRAIVQGGTPVGDYKRNMPGYERQGGELCMSAGITRPNGTGFSGEIGYTKEYAPHVEYGHHQIVGRYVPAIGKQIKKGYVPGQHFLKKNVEAQRHIFRQDLIDNIKKGK
ncbi:hypothetical protein [Eubacterium aggregans]|uniref:hypothetical protein n=1 Tax=Eubacterium aggregans TaxID=81409 RepID=UPI003F38120F